MAYRPRKDHDGGMLRASGSSVFPQVRYLIRNMPVSVAMLALASTLAGFAEAGILAILAQAALLLVNHAARVRITLGAIRLNPSLGALLVLGAALAVARLALAVVSSFAAASIGDKAQAHIRTGLFGAFAGASWDLQSRDREGHLQELVTNQAGQATLGYTAAASLIVASLTFLVLVITAVALNVFAALGIFVVGGGLSVLLRPLGSLGKRRAEALSQGWLAYAGTVNEAVRLAEEAHVFGISATQRERIDELMSVIRRPNLHVGWLASLVPGVYQGFIYLLLVLALMGLDALHAGHIASLGAVVLLLVRSGAYGQQMQAAVQGIRQGQPYAERLAEAERRYKESAPVRGGRALESVDSLTFADVSFGYSRGQPVLSNISFEITAGEAIGIIGPSGAGKSTLVQILLGLREPGSGSYFVNGEAASTYEREDWRTQFAYVPQEPRLLHASVRDNIRFLREIDDSSVERAARLAGIHDDVTTWRSGYDTIVGPRADAISGGQQQRICLARALAADPQVLILDEPTSALDPLTEQLIQESLLGLKEQLTLFIVAHRMSTLEFCERIMVIVGGRLEGFDAVAGLRDTNPYYRSVVSTMAPLSGSSESAG